MRSATSASQSSETSKAFLKIPVQRLEKRTCREEGGTMLPRGRRLVAGGRRGAAAARKEGGGGLGGGRRGGGRRGGGRRGGAPTREGAARSGRPEGRLGSIGSIP